MIWRWLRGLFCRIPVDIAEHEIIVRMLFIPYHVDVEKKKIKSAAFKSPYYKDEVSVIRHTYKNADFCKRKARKIDRNERKKRTNKRFNGFAVLSASEIRHHGSNVFDSRKVYCGHADIKHDYMPEPYKPCPPGINDRISELAKRARYYSDPQPDSKVWQGDKLR